LMPSASPDLEAAASGQRVSWGKGAERNNPRRGLWAKWPYRALPSKSLRLGEPEQPATHHLPSSSDREVRKRHCCTPPTRRVRLLNVHIPADNSSGMDDTNLTARMLEELDTLEAEEEQVSTERGRLHQQIDRGFASEMTRDRERELSRRRRELHQRIDVLRRRLGLPVGPQRRSDEGLLENVFSFGSKA